MSKVGTIPSRAPSLSTSARAKGALRIGGTINVVLAILVAGCGSDDGTPGSGAGSGGAPGSGGALGSGGTPTGTGGTQGLPTGGTASGGTGVIASGGTAPSGGTGSGNTAGKAGGDTGGSGAVAGADGGKAGSGGAPPTGGRGPAGGAAGAAAGRANGGATTGGAGASSGGSGGGGGTASGTCTKGTTKGNEVLFIGESFIAASSIPEETTKLARAAGSLGANDSYVDKSVSGTWIGNTATDAIPNQYKRNSNGVRFVLMNGGGNDCWQGGQESHRTAALNAAKSLFQEMGKNGVEKVVYFFYADPIGSQFNNLKACLDVLRPDMKAVCDAQTAPKCYWVDLRETWNGHPEYTSDGIHVAGPGNAPTAAAIFKSMQANCVAP